MASAAVVIVSRSEDKRGAGEIQRNSSLAPGQVADADGAAREKGRGAGDMLGKFGMESIQDESAKIIQHAALPRLIGDKTALRRKALLERVQLELELQRGLRLLMLCLCMFAVVIYAAVLESQAPVRRGLLNTYRSLFSLDNSLAEIKTRDDLFDFLRTVSKQARLIQPMSSTYFVEASGELKILSGQRPFAWKEVVEVPGTEPRVDSPSWSLMAWIQLRKDAGAHILRKPLGKTAQESRLSCWSWYVGQPSDRFEFGAHDFRGGSRTAEVQESVVGNGSSVADGILHSVAVVVTPTAISFYTDAELQSTVSISRPVTDCSGITLELGDADVPALGEVTFFARALTPVEMREIMFAGFTLQSIAIGKEIYSPEQTPFDRTASTSSEIAAAARDERAVVAQDLSIESSLTRQATEIVVNPSTSVSEPELVVPNSPGCRVIAPFGSDTSCHIMNLTEHDHVADPTLAGKRYFPLIKLEYMPPGKRLRDRVNLGLKKKNEYLNFDPDTFPSWCGKSATFSMWFEPKGIGGYILSRYKTSDTVWPAKYWTIYAGHNQLTSWIDSSGGGVEAALPTSFGNPLMNMRPGQRRHIAWTFDTETDKTCGYLDGETIGCEQHDSGVVGNIDCDKTGPDAYVGFGHRMPGAYQPEAVLQDTRYYHELLSPAEIRKLAYESVDEDGNSMRSCELSFEGGDTDWTDVNGKDCAWYQGKKKTVPTICATPEVNQNCPVACGYNAQCWEGEGGSAKQYTIWDRVMYLSEEKKGDGVICVREGVDAVAECRAKVAHTIPGKQDWLRFSRTPTSSYNNADIKLEDCDVLEQRISPYCSFAASEWTRSINAEVKANGGYTIDFWWKALPGTKIAERPSSWDEDPEIMRRIVFFSKMSPPEVLAEIMLMQTQRVRAHVYGSCSDKESENIDQGEGNFENGVWYHAALTLGNTNKDGKRGMWAFEGSTGAFDFADWDWCRDATMDFIQGMQLPGGVLLSPIEITSKPLGVKAIQQMFYDVGPKFAVRRGPAVDDHTRATETIMYERKAFPYPVSLVSPPILLQTRVEKSEVCKNEFGTAYQRKIWNDTIAGVTCEPPYECDEQLLNTSSALMSCSSDNIPSTFFGQTPLELSGKMQFYEFLQSITDAPILVRNGVPEQTEKFLDAQTQSLTVAMVAFSPEHGLASTISITASLGTDVVVDYSVAHFQSLEGDLLARYTLVSICGIALAVIILVEKIVTVIHKNLREELMGFIVDFVVQVFLPVIYFSVRWNQVSASKQTLSETVGIQGLSGVPWSSRSISLGDKIEQFFAGLELFESKIRLESLMATFYFFHATAALLRLIFQTSAHPRTAILVNTMIQAAGDLWHFLILFVVLNFGFIALGMAQFASDKVEFSSPLRSFETLWEMLLGSMIESGDIPSSTWSFDLLVMIYLISYNFFIFMIMLNFIIAIIVEAYMKVVTSIADMEADQEFCSDVTSVLLVSCKSVVLRWPGHMHIIDALQTCRKEYITYGVLRLLFPKWRRRGVLSFLHHYTRYDFVAPWHRKEVPEHEQAVQQTVAEIEERLAAMLGVPIPTKAERLMENKRLEMIGEVERRLRLGVDKPVGKKRMKRTTDRAPIIGPTLVPKNADKYGTRQANMTMSSAPEPVSFADIAQTARDKTRPSAADATDGTRAVAGEAQTVALLQEMMRRMERMEAKIEAQSAAETKFELQVVRASLPPPTSAQYVKTGQPDAVYNGYEITSGQGSCSYEPNPLPRLDRSLAHAGSHQVPPSRGVTRTQVRETLDAPHAQTDAGARFFI